MTHQQLTTICLAAGLFAFVAASPASAQYALFPSYPSPTGATFGAFGARTLGTPLAPKTRTMFPAEPRDRFGAQDGIGAGGPISVYDNRSVLRSLPPFAGDTQSQPFVQERQQLAAQVERAIVEAGPAGHQGAAQPQTLAAETRPMRQQPQNNQAPAANQPRAQTAAPAAGGTIVAPAAGLRPMRQPAGGAAPATAAPAAAAPTEVAPVAAPPPAPLVQQAFSAPAPEIQGGLADTFRRWERTRGAAVDIRPMIQGSTVVLRGRVPNEHDRLLAENLARLEPGVWNVRNELTVGP